MFYKILIIATSIYLSQMTGCLKAQYAKINDQYVEIDKPGGILGLVELKVSKIDSAFGFPAEEEGLTAYTIVNRSSPEKIAEDSSIKMFFEKRNDRFRWKVFPSSLSPDFYYSDTIRLREHTWYRLTTQKYNYHVYFYFDREKGTCTSILKSKAGGF